MPFNRENLPYEDFARFKGLDESKIENGFDQQQRDFLYREFVKSSFDDHRQGLKGSDADLRAVQVTLESVEDAHDVFGINKPNPDFELNVKSAFDIVDANNVDGVYDEFTPTQVVNKAAELLVDQPYSSIEYPQFAADGSITRGDRKTFIKQRLMTELEELNVDTANNSVDTFSTVRAKLSPVSSPEGETVNASLTDEEPGIAENLGRGVGSGFTDVIGKAIEGIDTLGNVIGSKIGEVRLLGNDANGDFQLIQFNSAEDVQKLVEANGGFSFGAVGDIGNSIQSFSKDIAEEADKDAVAFKTGNVIGQLAGFAGSAVAGGTAGAGAVAVTSGVEFQNDDYEAAILAKGEKFDVDVADNVALWGGLVGSLESIPGIRAAGRLLGAKTSPQLLKVLDDASGGAIKRFIKNGIPGAAEEALQEVMSNIASNYVASDLVAYDKERNLWQGTQESAEVGGAAGFILNGLAGLIGGRRAANSDQSNISSQPEEVTEEGVEPSPTDNTKTQVSAAVNEATEKGQPNESTPVNEGEGLQTVTQQTGQLINGDTVNIVEDNRDENGEGTVSIARPGGDITELSTTQSIDRAEIENIFGTIETVESPVPNFLTDEVRTFNTDSGEVIVSRGGRTGRGATRDEALADLKEPENETEQEQPTPSTDVDDGDFSAVTFDPVTPVRAQQKETIAVSTRGVKSDTNLSGFKGVKLAKPKQLQETLEGDGFIVSGKVTDAGFTAVKDGLTYTTKLRRRKGSGEVIARTKVTDQQGITVGPIQTRSLSDTEGGLKNEGNFSIDVPQVGIRINSEVAGGERSRGLIDAQSVEEVAQRTGGSVDFAESTIAKITYDNGSYVTIERPESGTDRDNYTLVTSDTGIERFEDGEFIQIKGGKRSTSVITSELAQAGYTLDSVDKGVFKMTSPEGRKVVVDEVGDIQTVDGEPVSINQLRDVIDETSPEPSPERITEFSLLQAQDRIDTNIDAIEDNVIVADNGQRVVLDAFEGDNEALMLDIEVSNVVQTDIDDNDVSGAFKQPTWKVSDIDEMLKRTLPEHIYKTIKLHEDPDNPVIRNGARGYFIPRGDSAGKFIHVDASSNQPSLGTVLSTLSEELAHFSHDSWSLRSMTELYDTLYSLVKPQAVAGLQAYIKKGNIDVDNPTASEKQLLINEYFSKQNTSILDFVDSKVALPPGIDQARLQQIKNEVSKGGINKVVFDLTKDYDGGLSAESVKMMEDVLRLQASKVVGNGFIVTYKQNNQDGTTSDMVVKSTQYGSNRRVYRDTDNGQRIRRLIELDEDAQAGDIGAEFKRKLLSYHPTNPLLGRNITILLAEGFKGERTTVVDALRTRLSQSNEINRIMLRNGIREVEPGRSYEKAFMQAGVKNKKDLKKARDIDDVLRQSVKTKYQNVAQIQRLYRDKIELVNDWVVDKLITPQQAAAMVGSLKKSARRFSSDWTHRRYTAYTDGDKANLQRMLVALKGDSDVRPTLNQAAEAAQVEIDRLEAKPSLSAKENRKIADLYNDVSIAERMNALYEYARNTREGNAVKGTVVKRATTKRDNADINAYMRGLIDDLIRDHHRSGNSSIEKIEQVDAVKGRTLDPESEVDQLYMTFLNPITDSMSASIFDVEQQSKVIESLKSSVQLAEALVSDNIAKVTGSDVQQGVTSTSFGGGRRIQQGQKGTLLEFIEVDNALTDEVNGRIELSQEFNNGMINKLVSFVKSNLTIRNPFGIASNYAGIVGMNLSSGHLFDFEQLRESGTVTRDLWKRNYTFTKSGSDFGQTIAEEMTSGNLVGTGLTAAVVDASGTDLITETVETAVKYVESGTGTQGSRAGESAVSFFTKLDNGFRKVFSFPDDVTKILPYLSNRSLMVLEAETKLNKDDFLTPEDYQQAVLDYAIPKAIDRTRRETVNWALAPLPVARIGQGSNVRLFTPDFFGHFVQMARIVTENHVMIAEDYKAMREAKDNGHNELAKRYARTVAQRVAGTSLNDLAWYGIISAGARPFADMLHFIASSIQDDEDPNQNIVNKKQYSDKEYNAAKVIGRIAALNSITGQLFDPLPVRDGYKMKFSAFQRSNPSLSFAAPITLDGDSVPLDFGKGVLKSFLPVGSPTLSNKIATEILVGKDAFGNDVSKEQALKNIGGALLTPQVVQQMYAIAAGETLSGSRHVNRMDQLATSVGGVKTVEQDLRRIVTNYAYSITDFNNRRADAKTNEMFKVLLQRDELDMGRIKSLMDTHHSRVKDKSEEIQVALTAFRDVGLSDRQIKVHLTKQPSGKANTQLSAKKANILLSGGDIFTTSLITKLNNKRKSIGVDDRYRTQQDVDNVTRNLQRAIDYYKTL